MDSQPSPVVPASTQILVIGGGPAGSYSSTLLAREGFQVTLLERDVFPRYHIGESLLPSTRQFMSLIDGVHLIEDHGFAVKPGAVVKLNQHSREGYTDFTAMGPKSGAWNVVRSEMDDIMLKYAGRCGVNVIEGVQIKDIEFDKSAVKEGEDSVGRPTSATWKSQSGESGIIKFDWLVDASGRAGIISTKYMKSRVFNKTLKNFASWGYWTGAGIYAPGTNRSNAPWFEAMTDQSGWCWFIPLHNGTVSVGVVENEEISVKKRKELRSRLPESSLKDHYMEQLKFAPGLGSLLSSAQFTESSGVKSASDYSYNSPVHSGDHFRVIGDAGAFIDPFFSSGVHLAWTGGLSAACSIAASIRGHCTEKEANGYHDTKVSTAYTRFLVVVYAIYKQIKAQNIPVLQDIDENHFDRAFIALRPVIQGSADVGKELTDDEVQAAMDFVGAVFDSSEELNASVCGRIKEDLLKPDAPMIMTKDIVQLVGEKDHEAIRVLQQLNARKVTRPMYDINSQFAHESVGGLVAICQRGSMGLVKVPEEVNGKA